MEGGGGSLHDLVLAFTIRIPGTFSVSRETLLTFFDLLHGLHGKNHPARRHRGYDLILCIHTCFVQKENRPPDRARGLDAQDVPSQKKAPLGIFSSHGKRMKQMIEMVALHPAVPPKTAAWQFKKASTGRACRSFGRHSALEKQAALKHAMRERPFRVQGGWGTPENFGPTAWKPFSAQPSNPAKSSLIPSHGHGKTHCSDKQKGAGAQYRPRARSGRDRKRLWNPLCKRHFRLMNAPHAPILWSS